MMPKLPRMNTLSEEQNRRAEDLCLEHKALPQSSTRCFTSKFKAGTLPLQAYLIDEAVIDQEAMHDDAEEEDSHTGIRGVEIVSEEIGYIDEAPEWDSSSSDDDGLEDNDDGSHDDVPAQSGFKHVNQATVTRSGRQIRASKHFMYDSGMLSFLCENY